jgi:hypothetical protein
MLIEEIKGIRSGKKELRQFAVIIGIACCVLGALLWWRGKTYYPYSFVCAAVLFLTGLILPAALKPFHKAWMTLSVLMGWLMTRLILIILFYVILTPIALISRLCGKDFLDKKINKNASSYWVPRDKQTDDKKSYEQQF